MTSVLNRVLAEVLPGITESLSTECFMLDDVQHTCAQKCWLLFPALGNSGVVIFDGVCTASIVELTTSICPS